MQSNNVHREPVGPSVSSFRTDQGSVCLVGGTTLIREGLVSLLRGEGFEEIHSVPDADALVAHLDEVGEQNVGVLVLLLSGGPFSTFHRIRESLQSADRELPMVVLAEQSSRGQIYTALRIGAKAYVNFDAAPSELFKAIHMASENHVYLTPEATELLVADVSTAVDTSQNQRLPRNELSQRETEIVQLLCEGLSSKEIARRLHISAKTVENHRYNIYRKCEVDSIAALMRLAIQRGLVSI